MNQKIILFFRWLSMLNRGAWLSISPEAPASVQGGKMDALFSPIFSL
jgi:hypothetical protein